MDTYTILREFADSWWLIAMTAFFIGQVAWTLRPGSGPRHAEIAAIPLRNDTLPSPDRTRPGEISDHHEIATPADAGGDDQ